MRNVRGFTLVEIAVVLVIVAIVIAMAAFVTRAISGAQRRSITVTRLANVDLALVQFVTLQKRLPCPADGTLASTNAGAGLETARTAALGCTTTEQNGVVPWRAIGLTEADITDGWDRRMTYRLPVTLAIDNGMDMSACDPAGGAAGPAGGACVSPCTAATIAACMPPLVFLDGKGLTIQTTAGTVVMSPPSTGAAYVVISHGESGGGAYLNSGQLSTSTSTDGTEEQKNYANMPLALYYVDDAITDAAGATHFDDVVSRPTVLSVANKAGLGPRTH